MEPDYEQAYERLRLAAENIVNSGEFAAWVREQTMPFAAAREFNELATALNLIKSKPSVTTERVDAIVALPDLGAQIPEQGPNEPCGNEDDCDKCYPLPRWTISEHRIQHITYEREIKAATAAEALKIFNERTAWPTSYDDRYGAVVQQDAPVVEPVTDEVVLRMHRTAFCWHDLDKQQQRVDASPEPTGNVNKKRRKIVEKNGVRYEEVPGGILKLLIDDVNDEDDLELTQEQVDALMAKDD